MLEKILKQQESISDPVQKLIKSSKFNFAFFFMTTLSSIIATFGILSNNVSVIIGSMVIAPLLVPLLSLSTGIISFNGKLLAHALISLIGGLLCGFIASALITFIAQPQISFQMYRLFEINYIYSFLIAIAAGMAGMYSWFKPHLSENIAGIAISVALVPPLAFFGIMFGLQDWIRTLNTSVTIMANIAGIFLGAAIVFIALSNNHFEKKFKKEVAKEIDKE